ncbi:MAG: PAS domain S-box protein, partial [Deltaproteobacteria bacterium]
MTTPPEVVSGVLQNAECLRLLVEAARDYAVFWLDPRGLVSSWNEGAVALKGYAAAEIVGRHFSVFYAVEDREQGDPDHGLRVAGELGRFEEEGWRVRKDGSRFWARIVITALRDANGDLVGFAKVTRDLREHRVADMRFRLLEFAPDGVLVVDGQGAIVYANPRATALFGHDPAELLERNVDDLVPERFRDKHAGKRARLLSEPSARTIGNTSPSVFGLRKDGTEFPAEISLSPMSGEGALVILFIRDNTDVRRLERERARAADHVARLNALGEALSGAVDLGEVGAAILSSGLAAAGVRSAAIGRVVNQGREIEVLGEAGGVSRHVAEAAALVEAAGFRIEYVAGRLRSPVDTHFPLETAVRTGSAQWLHDLAEIREQFPALAPLLASGGSRALACLPLISRGVTIGALRLSFTEDRSFDREERIFLMSFANQCALALDRAHLYEEAIEARGAAERATLLRDEFLSIVAHDLGNPMNVVGLWARLIHDAATDGAEGETTRKGARSITEGVKRMATLLHDLGDVSSMDAGHLGLRKQEQDLEAIAAEAVRVGLAGGKA